MEKLAEFEQSMVMQILVLLLRGPMKITDLIDQVIGSGGTVYRIIPRLRDLGLINDEAKRVYPVARILSLTPKGRRVAEKLKEIQDILEEP